MVSYDPWTPPLAPTAPVTIPSPTLLPLPVSKHVTIRTKDESTATEGNQAILGFKRVITSSKNGTKVEMVDLHEFDGAECIDAGSSLSPTETQDEFHIIPLLPPPSNHPVLPPTPTNHTSTPAINTTAPPHTKCIRCGLNRTSSHNSNGSETHSPHGTHCLPAYFPDIEASSICPDIVSPSSPSHDAHVDPFEAYQLHRQHSQGHTHSRLSISLAPEEASIEAVDPITHLPPPSPPSNGATLAPDKDALDLEHVTTHGSLGEVRARKARQQQIRAEKLQLAREQMYYGDAKVDAAVRGRLLSRDVGTGNDPAVNERRQSASEKKEDETVLAVEEKVQWRERSPWRGSWGAL